MKHSLLYGLAVSSLLLFSCSKEEMPDYGNEANEPTPLTLENVTLKDFDAENPSRASYNQDAATVFVQNDKLGLILLKKITQERATSALHTMPMRINGRKMGMQSTYPVT